MMDARAIIKNLSHNIKVILMTRDGNWRETLLSSPEEVDFILLEPFPPEKLISAIASVLKNGS